MPHRIHVVFRFHNIVEIDVRVQDRLALGARARQNFSQRADDNAATVHQDRIGIIAQLATIVLENKRPG